MFISYNRMGRQFPPRESLESKKLFVGEADDGGGNISPDFMGLAVLLVVRSIVAYN
jgi:hypothetical protein